MAQRDGSMVWRKAGACESRACVEVAFGDDGRVHVRSSLAPDAPALGFTRLEWQTFITAIRAGEFDLA
ncbi:MAG TPA: DUF397 domain-containing protein [Pilimelia sp.]|nr:DUF397 domain-containing protein [Pilimelia sp.]